MCLFGPVFGQSWVDKILDKKISRTQAVYTAVFVLKVLANSKMFWQYVLTVGMGVT